MSLKQTIIKDTLQYSIANYMAMAIGIVVSIAIKAVLGTVGAGYWALMKVFSSYGEYSDLGTRDALLREIPQALGAGQEARGETIRNNAFSFSVAAAVFSAAAILAAAVFAVKDVLLRNGLFVVAFLVIATQLYNYFLTLLRTLKKVSALSRLIVGNMLLVALFPLAGAWLSGVVGLASGFLVATAVSAFLAYRSASVSLRLEWDGPEIWRLVRIGLPMVALSYALITFLSLDAVMIGRLLGYEALGFYTIALMAVQQVSTLGRFAHIIIFPHIQERYGRDRSLEASKSFFVRSTRALVHFIPIAIAMIYFLVPLVVHLFLPRFEPGIPAMKILLVGYFFIAVNEMSSTILFTADKQSRLIPIYGAMIVLAGVLNLIFIRSGFGIEGVALATALAYFSFFAAVFTFSFGRLLSPKELRKLLFLIAGVFGYFVLLVLVIDRWISHPVYWAASILKAVVFLLAYLPTLAPFEKEERVLASVAAIVGLKGRLGTRE